MGKRVNIMQSFAAAVCTAAALAAEEATGLSADFAD